MSIILRERHSDNDIWRDNQYEFKQVFRRVLNREEKRK